MLCYLTAPHFILSGVANQSLRPSQDGFLTQIGRAAVVSNVTVAVAYEEK